MAADSDGDDAKRYNPYESIKCTKKGCNTVLTRKALARHLNTQHGIQSDKKIVKQEQFRCQLCPQNPEKWTAWSGRPKHYRKCHTDQPPGTWPTKELFRENTEQPGEWRYDCSAGPGAPKQSQKKSKTGQGNAEDDAVAEPPQRRVAQSRPVSPLETVGVRIGDADMMDTVDGATALREREEPLDSETSTTTDRSVGSSGRDTVDEMQVEEGDVDSPRVTTNANRVLGTATKNKNQPIQNKWLQQQTECERPAFGQRLKRTRLRVASNKDVDLGLGNTMFRLEDQLNRSVAAQVMSAESFARRVQQAGSGWASKRQTGNNKWRHGLVVDTDIAVGKLLQGQCHLIPTVMPFFAQAETTELWDISKCLGWAQMRADGSSVQVTNLRRPWSASGAHRWEQRSPQEAARCFESTKRHLVSCEFPKSPARRLPNVLDGYDDFTLLEEMTRGLDVPEAQGHHVLVKAGTVWEPHVNCLGTHTVLQMEKDARVGYLIWPMLTDEQRDAWQESAGANIWGIVNQLECIYVGVSHGDRLLIPAGYPYACMPVEDSLYTVHTKWHSTSMVDSAKEILDLIRYPAIGRTVTQSWIVSILRRVYELWRGGTTYFRWDASDKLIEFAALIEEIANAIARRERRD